MEKDPQNKLNQNCEITSKKRRETVSLLSTMETRAAKKARLLTIVTPETPSSAAYVGDRSLSLISPPITDSSPEASLPIEHEMRGQTPTKPINSSLAENKSSFTFTSPLGGLSFMAAPILNGTPDVCEPNSFITSHIGQNFDGTWFINYSAATLSHTSCIKPGMRKTRSASKAKSTPIPEQHAEMSDDENPNLKQQEQKRSNKKRKVDDDELSFQEELSSPRPVEEAEEVFQNKPPRKRKSSKVSAARVRNAKLPLYHENVQEGKPDPIGQPEVWAFKRQQLCETLPYYNAYQSGAYTQDGIARSILIDKEVSFRDKFDDEVIITSVGGGRLFDEETGRMVYKKDQIFSSIANAFMRAMELKSPVAVIAGQGNKISPSKLPHYYNVLDWFHVTDVWQEKVLGHNDIRVSVWKVRLEKIDLSQRSWWTALAAPQRDNGVHPMAEMRTCSICKLESKIRFNIGPVCLNISCSKFFDFGVEYDDRSLDYHTSFLKERTKYVGNPPEPLAPNPPTDGDPAQDNAYGYEKLCKRGIVCQKCGCCTRRIEWRQWSCENDKCDYTHRVKQLLVPLSEVVANAIDAVKEVDTGNEQRSDKFKPPHKNIPCSQSTVGSYDLYNYDLPNESGEIAGSIRHFKSNRRINMQRDGPNDLFREVQGSQLDLKRGIAVHKGTTQETLTNHFTENFGAAYKYLVAQDSKGFDKAPPAIIKAAKRMIWAGQHALLKSQEPYQPFNECLVLGYFDGSKIGYHDDGEKTLGPTVATLSLGANATMNFRPKKKTCIPLLQEGNVRGRGRGKGIISDDARVNDTKNKSENPAVLSIKLEHGDIVIMHGREIQKLFEHEVIPNGGLRFALTCRHIDPQTLPNDEERRIAAEKGAFPPGSEQYDYDGSVHATAIVPQLNRGINISNDIMAKFKLGELEMSDIQIILQGLTEYVSNQGTST